MFIVIQCPVEFLKYTRTAIPRMQRGKATIWPLIVFRALCPQDGVVDLTS